VYEKALNRIKGGQQKVFGPVIPWAGRGVAIPGGMGRKLLCDDGGISSVKA
jgi:hypothetical protein